MRGLRYASCVEAVDRISKCGRLVKVPTHEEKRMRPLKRKPRLEVRQTCKGAGTTRTTPGKEVSCPPCKGWGCHPLQRWVSVPLERQALSFTTPVKDGRCTPCKGWCGFSPPAKEGLGAPEKAALLFTTPVKAVVAPLERLVLIFVSPWQTCKGARGKLRLASGGPVKAPET